MNCYRVFPYDLTDKQWAMQGKCENVDCLNPHCQELRAYRNIENPNDLSVRDFKLLKVLLIERQKKCERFVAWSRQIGANVKINQADLLHCMMLLNKCEHELSKKATQ